MSGITNYDGLVAKLETWLDRDDLDADVDTFIQLTEARLNRLLDDPEMEVTTETAASGDYTALPADFGSMVSISTGDGQLKQVGTVEFSTFDSTSGIPRYYTIQDGSIGLYPRNSTATIRMVYRRRIPALTSGSPTNWLLTLAPDVYLYGCLVQAFGWDQDDDRVGGWKSLFDEAVAELRSDGARRKWGPGPIAPRIRRA
jgi:hypothetical protein